MFIHKTRSIVNFIMNDDVKILNYAFALRPIRLPSPRPALEQKKRKGRWSEGATEALATKTSFLVNLIRSRAPF